EQNEYQQAFEKARANPGAGPLDVPWIMTKPERIQYFWTYYFENVSPHQVQPQEAWRKLVPLRRPAGVTAGAAWLPGSIRFHAFHYPHALALVALVGLKADLSLFDAVSKAHEISHGGVFDASFTGNPPIRSSLAPLAGHALDLMRSAAFGPGTPPG